LKIIKISQKKPEIQIENKEDKILETPIKLEIQNKAQQNSPKNKKKAKKEMKILATVLEEESFLRTLGWVPEGEEREVSIV